jgi:hypothetical protein
MADTTTPFGATVDDAQPFEAADEPLLEQADDEYYEPACEFCQAMLDDDEACNCFAARQDRRAEYGDYRDHLARG